MLRRRRAAVRVGDATTRLLERAVGVAQQVGRALTLVERAWASRHELAAVVAARRSDQLDVFETRRVPSTEPELLAPEPTPPPEQCPPEEEPTVEIAWVLARHLATEMGRWSTALHEAPWREGADRIEGLRRMRVATRRLRTLVDLFRPDLPDKTAKRARRTLRRIGRALGPLRELDVHVQRLEALGCETNDPAVRVGIEHVLERIERRRARAEARARACIGDTDWATLRTDLEALTDRLVGPLVRSDADASAWVRQRLTPHADRLFHALEPMHAHVQATGLSTVDFEAVHALRIEAKRLRYAIDLVRPALTESELVLRKRLRRLQRVVGEHRDATLLHDQLVAMRSKLETRGRTGLCQALSALVERLERRRIAAGERVPSALAELHELRPTPP